MLITLLKIRLASIYASMFRGSKIKKKRNPALKVLIGLFAVYVIGCVFFMFGGLAYSLCQPLVSASLSWFYFSLFFILAVAFCFLLSLFVAKGTLFDAKDNDLLLSMPIRPGAILASRVLSLLLLQYLYAAMVLLPAGAVYWYFNSLSVSGVLCFILCFLASPLLALVLTCIFGWLIAWLSSKLRNENIITMVVSVIFLVAYFWAYSKVNSYIGLLIARGEDIAATIKKVLWPAYLFGTAVADSNYVNLFLFILCGLAPVTVMYLILSRSFIRIATANKGVKKIQYRERALKVSSPRSALIRKEMTHFISNPMYVLNAGLGAILMLIGAVVLLVKQDYVNTIIISAPELVAYLSPLVCLFLGLLASTDLISAPSISLEGKNLWIAQSLPVPMGDVLLAKADTHIIICLPSTVVLSLVLCLLLPVSAADVFFILALPVVLTAFTALLGVMVNLKFPKFDWTNETAVIKQGLATMITMFLSWGILAVPALLYVFLLKDILSAELYLLIWTAVFGLLSLLMRRYLTTRGAKIFASL